MGDGFWFITSIHSAVRVILDRVPSPGWLNSHSDGEGLSSEFHHVDDVPGLGIVIGDDTVAKRVIPECYSSLAMGGVLQVVPVAVSECTTQIVTTTGFPKLEVWLPARVLHDFFSPKKRSGHVGYRGVG